ncbi:hypothetical protein HNO88_000499 [Novosphingobium chloroacetimidivorans]|uniref:Uncharacterized protein n=1 Tax=Novosphingobium chloroacetimidivorans TaxID=1428314 RepID=A0A7W7K6K9_9SPHN|nr:hypothetical protein [Novosphingobium chloroacetimidivorans]MBB4857192.1 hypothetical protein [Novosphingobium chloroacetimidivorans]
MKYAYVLVHHIGDQGEAAEGRILHVSDERFRELGPDGSGLVRDATSEEVKAGYQPAFEKDGTTAPEILAEGGEGQKQKPAPSNKQAPEPKNKDA